MDINDVKKFLTDDSSGKKLLSELVESSSNLEGIKKKNQELIENNKKLKGDAEKYQTKVSELEGELETRKGGDPKLQKENENLKSKLSDYEKQLDSVKKEAQKDKIDRELRSAVSDAKISRQHEKAILALLKSENDIKVDDVDANVKVGEKSIKDFVAEWAQTDIGKNYVSAPDNSGGGAGGSSKATPQDLSKMDARSRLTYLRSKS